MRGPLRYILFGAHPFWCKVTLPRLESIGKATCAAIVDSDLAKLDMAASRLEMPRDRTFTDPLKALQECTADFAVIATPGDQHEKYVDMCLTFDLHMLLEPPLADSMPSAARIYRRVRDIGKRCMVASAAAMEQDKQTLLQTLRTREVGRLSHLAIRFAQNFRKVNSWSPHRHMMRQPLLLEAAMQHFELFRMATGVNARTIFSQSWNTLWGEFKGDTSALVTIEMENGVHCLYEGTVVAAASTNPWGFEQVRAECEKGSIDLDNRRLRVSMGEALDRPRYEDVPLVAGDAFGHPWIAEQFCDWCRKGPLPPTHLKDHIQTVAMTFAAIESAETGRPVNVQEYLEQQLSAAKQVVRGEKAAGAQAPASGADAHLTGELPV